MTTFQVCSVHKIMRTITLLSLFIYVLTISFTHEIQESDELYEQIAILNKKIAPIAKLATSLPNALNALTDGSLFARGLERIDARQQANLISRLISQSFLKLAPFLDLVQETDISQAAQELIKSLSLNRQDIVNNLINFEPFIPATDINGNLSCLNDSTLNDLCLQDLSYPKWYTIMIAPAVEETLNSVLGQVEDLNECIQRPKTECNGTYSTGGSLTTGKFPGSSNETNKYSFLLQTRTLEQRLSVRKCMDTTQTCSDPSNPGTPVKCESVTDGPTFTVGKRSTTLKKSLVINTSGLVELAEMDSKDFLCWCKCMRAGDGYGTQF